VRVAHRVLDLKVRHAVAELSVTGLLPHPLQLTRVLAFLIAPGFRWALIDCPDTRMCMPTSLPF